MSYLRDRTMNLPVQNNDQYWDEGNVELSVFDEEVEYEYEYEYEYKYNYVYEYVYN